MVMMYNNITTMKWRRARFSGGKWTSPTWTENAFMDGVDLGLKRRAPTTSNSQKTKPHARELRKPYDSVRPLVTRLNLQK